MVMQYNKRDLESEGIELFSVEDLEATLNERIQVPSFPASAASGMNVVETMKKIISLTVVSLKEKLG